MNPLCVIEKYYNKNTSLYNLLVKHSNDVTKKAIEITDNHPELNINKEFIKEAGMLHDIGIYKTGTQGINCYGEYPYIAHGYLGSEILQMEGMPKHALVCERHTGAGLTINEIIDKKLPLPHREMMPISMEEQIICFADCFFSKSNLDEEKSIESIKRGLAKFGERSVKQFDHWCKIFL